MKHTGIKINSLDNVAVAIVNLKKGDFILEGVRANEDTPQGHKIALEDIHKGQFITRYGVHIGYALKDIKKGDWVNENTSGIPTAPSLEDIQFSPTNRTHTLPKARATTFEGYEVAGEKYAGTRNILGISTTVQCVTGVLNVALKKIKEEVLPKYKNVDDVVAINHDYGCGVAINAKNSDIPKRILRNLVKNPNFGGEVMVVSLGCEKFTVEMLLDKELINPDNVIVLQEKQGFSTMLEAIVGMAEKKLQKLNERKRSTLPLSKLSVGMQCGGSDAFSGISANPAAGYASDMLVSAGATVMFSEVTEARDGVHILAEKCADEEVVKKLVSEMKWYDDYLELCEADRTANTTPGNKKGGLSNIVEKAMGSIVKSGHAPIVEVLSPGERPTKSGLIYAATPSSDMVCGPSQLASGVALEVFMTGRGTPYGLAPVPVIKVSSRNDLKGMWSDLIDISAGDIVTGEATIEEVGEKIFDEIVLVASGKKKVFAEKYQLHNDLCIFNPAPIT